MRHLDLFSGIGGFALAARNVWGDGHEVIAFCEIDKFCQKVLKKHWPDTEIIGNIKCVIDWLLQAGFRARMYRSQTRKQSASQEIEAAFGKKCLKRLASYNRITRSWRTCRDCGDGSEEFSRTWPRSGMTHNGTAYQLAPLVRHKEGIGSGLLPTPAASQVYKPIRCMAPSEKNCGHGTMLIAYIGTRWPKLIGAYLTGGFLGAIMGYPENWSALPTGMPLFRRLRK